MARKPDTPIATNVNYREYRPDDRFSDGYRMALRHLTVEFIRYRSHIKTMFGQEFRNSYRGTRLGVFWNFFLPLLPISIYVLLSNLRVLPSFEGLPAALAISCNVTLWFLFADCVRIPIGVVQRRNAEAMKTSLPLSTAIASSFARSLFETLVRAVAVVVVAVAMKVVPAHTAPAAIAVILLGSMLFLASGLILAIFNVVVPDVERLVTVALQYGIFLSGVIFPLSAAGFLGVLQELNPFAVFISAARDLLFLGRLSHALALGAWASLGVLALVVALRLFYVMEQRIRGVV